jgi:hypothetical protein
VTVNEVTDLIARLVDLLDDVLGPDLSVSTERQPDDSLSVLIEATMGP